MATIWFCVRALGNNGVSPCATKAASPEASRKHTELSGQLSLHLQWRISPPTLPSVIQPPCCCFSNLPQLWLGSNWTVHFLTFSRPRWLNLPTGWVALLPGSQVHAKYFHLLSWFWFYGSKCNLIFYNWLHGWITKPPLKGLVVKHCHCVNSSVLFRPVKWTAKRRWNNNAYISN